MTTANATIMIPFSQLARTDHNARRTNKTANIPALAASIAAQGVLQNLVVSLAGNGTYAVHAGDRRYQAIALLIEQGKRPADFKVPCKVIDVGNATAASLAENTMREAMHPADEFDAFVKLKEEQFTIDQIADAFGVTPLVVERRLKLTKAAPALLEEFRAGNISTDQLIGLCATDDHEKQIRVWRNAQSWNRKQADLRSAVLAGEVNVSTDKRIPFIGGLQVYRDAGGSVRQDLFSGDGSGGFITDTVLLDELVTAKIRTEAARYEAAGWGFVEVQTELDDTALSRMGRLSKDAAILPEDVAATVEAMREEARQLNAQAEALLDNDNDELSEAESAEFDAKTERAEELFTEANELAEQKADYPAELKAKAGVILAYTGGELRIEVGRVKTADRAAVAKIAGSTNAVQGGRETEAAGRKGDALSDALRRSLLGHRNLAAQIATASRPNVAKVLLACSMVERIRSSFGGGYRGAGTPCDYVIGRDGCGGTRTYHPINDDGGKAAGQAFMDRCSETVKALPQGEDALWDALAAMQPGEIDNIIAVGVALSVSLNTEHKGLTAKFLAAIEFDMSEQFTPTAENYLGKVSKPLIVEALKEAGKITSKADTDALLAMKKGALATEAEKRLAGSGWVPSLIRTPKPKTPAAPKAAKPAAKAKPATAAKQKSAEKKAAPAKPAKKTAA